MAQEFALVCEAVSVSVRDITGERLNDFCNRLRHLSVLRLPVEFILNSVQSYFISVLTRKCFTCHSSVVISYLDGS